MIFPVRVEVSLRPGIADPAAATITRSLPAMGFEGVSELRTGKAFWLDVEAASADEALEKAQALADRLLSNPVIEQSVVCLAEAS